MGGSDRIAGDSDDDQLAGDGSLTDQAQGGNDSVLGGDGNDDVFGDGQRISKAAQGGNDLVIGGLGNDELFGDAVETDATISGGNDILIGVDPSVELPGTGEFDQLTGNGGADLFVLGNTETAFYLGEGDIDHAAIFDFSLLEGDRIVLNGSSHDYSLQNFVVDDTCLALILFVPMAMTSSVQSLAKLLTSLALPSPQKHSPLRPRFSPL